jgi:hypothetical protein
MKRFLAIAAALPLISCTSLESAQVSGNEIAAHGEPIAVIQANAVGLSALLHMVDLVPADLDVSVNRLLVSEAKAMGASKVDLKTAEMLPRHGIFALFTCLLPIPILLCGELSSATGVAVK